MKDITGHVVPDQAQFGPKYFLAFMLLDFKSKIHTWLLEAKKEDNPILFSLMGQCFQDVSLTEWTNGMEKWCSNNTHLTKENSIECIRDYLEAVARFPSIGVIWFVGFALPRSPRSCWCMSLCGVKCSSSATLMVVTSIEQWSYPWHKRKANKSFLPTKGTSV